MSLSEALGGSLLLFSISGILAYWIMPWHQRKYVRRFLVFNIILFLWTSFWMFIYP